MRKVELKKLMDNLYDSLDYFASIPPDGKVDYEENYHHTTLDPDGKPRYLLREREIFLAGVREITTYVENLTPGKVLDIGCGLGWILSSLNDRWEKHGVEVSRFASKHAAQFGKIHNGTLDGYIETGFDVIVMNHVIEHLNNPLQYLAKVREMLKPTGIFIIGTPDFDSAAARRYGANFRLLHDPTHVSLFSADSMHRCLRDIGFKINRVEYPYFETPWFNKDALLGMLGEEGISPPFYGSNMTFFCERTS